MILARLSPLLAFSFTNFWHFLHYKMRRWGWLATPHHLLFWQPTPCMMTKLTPPSSTSLPQWPSALVTPSSPASSTEMEAGHSSFTSLSLMTLSLVTTSRGAIGLAKWGKPQGRPALQRILQWSRTWQTSYSVGPALAPRDLGTT